MAIDSVTSVNSLDQLGQIGQIGQTSGSNFGASSSSKVDNETYSFGSVLSDAIDNVETTNQNVTAEAEKLATGQTDNLHDITIASTEANLAVQLFVQLRNKTVKAYQEIMNLNI